MKRIVCVAYISVPSSWGIFVYKLETSIDTKIVSLSIFVFSIKLMKSVVSFVKDCCFCAIGWSNVSTNEIFVQ